MTAAGREEVVVGEGGEGGGFEVVATGRFEVVTGATLVVCA